MGHSGFEDDDDEDEEEFEEGGGRANRLLGFMFGNVDNSGDLDVDYLDEDAKEHLAALADKLGPSLDIDLSEKSPRTPADTAEQDYDDKAEDAVDYEDIDEQYEGPETQDASEEDHLLPKKEFFSSEISLSSLGTKASVFGDEDYDEEEGGKEEELDIENEVHPTISGEQEYVAEEALEAQKSSNDDSHIDSANNENMVDDADAVQNVGDVLEKELDGRERTPLPILCVEDGMVILRFSEIFGIHEPLNRRDRGDSGYSTHKEKYKFMDASDFVEEDEETFLRGSSQDVSFIKQESAVELDISESNGETSLQGDSTIFVQGEEFTRDHNISALPMKEELDTSISSRWQFPLYEEFILLEHEDWEEQILWDTSPARSDNSLGGPNITASDIEASVVKAGLGNSFMHRSNISLESFGSSNPSGSVDLLASEKKLHPRLLRLESQLDDDTIGHAGEKMDDAVVEPSVSSVMSRFRELTLLNRGIMEGSWLDDIIWEPHGAVAKPKLVLDLQDEQMLFEILDNKDSEHLQFHAGAMVITRSMNSSDSVSLEQSGHQFKPGWQFNIANDKFYVNRKVPQQLQSNTNKRMFHSIRVYHSAPALKLQTMKLKLSNKDLANFHRPKALWYPHANEVAVKEQGKLPSQGSMRIIVKSLGGKGSKVHVDAEESVSSVKAKASKKLDFKPTETVKFFYLGKELEDDKSLAAQNVQTNSLLHLIRTKIHLLPRAQKVPGEGKAIRPPGAFKKKSDLSAKDGRVFLMEYCEERPLLLGNAGMGANLVTYYQKSVPGDQNSSLLRSGNSSLGNILVLEPGDRSPFLGDIKPGCSQSSLETNMYKAPIFPHKVQSTDFLLIRSTKGKLSIRRIDKIATVGQQEPLMEVMSPGSKNLQTYIMNRMLVYVYREFSAAAKRGLLPCMGTNELSSLFPNLSEALVRKKLKECATLKRDKSGQLTWYMKTDFHIPSEGVLRKLVSPEHVCAYESMLAGLHRLKHLGITRQPNPTAVSLAMSQLPDEAIALAAAAHIERELQITPWNLSSNFVACTNQDRENIERLEITGVGDPTGRGLGFSYVRITPKAPMSSSMAKKKAAAGRGGTSVTGTDADLRRLSMEAAREVLLKFNVPDEVIEKQTRWHRIAMIRKLSSEQAASGVKVDPTTIGKYARGQRMSFLQLQQQTREKCQEIWDRQIQSLSAVEGGENESDSEANSDLDSFAGDLENLLDAEEFEEGEEGNRDSKQSKVDGVKGLKMRRHPLKARVEEEIEDEAAEAAELYRLLMDDDEVEQKKKKKKKNKAVMEDSGFALGSQPSVNVEVVERVKKTSSNAKPVTVTSQPNGSYITNDGILGDPKDEENSVSKLNMSGKMKGVKKIGVSSTGQVTKVKIVADNVKMFKEKKSSRESFVCGACGQPGHMRTNKNCPKYGEDPETAAETMDSEKAPAKSIPLDPSGQMQPKAVKKKLIPKTAAKIALVEATESEKSNSTNKVVPVKFKCSTDKAVVEATQGFVQPVTSDFEMGNKSGTKVIIKSSKGKHEQMQVEPQKPSIVVRTSVDSDRGQAELQKPLVVIRPPTNKDRNQIEVQRPPILIRPPMDREREQHPKIKIKRSKEAINQEQVSQDGGSHLEFRKTRTITEISSFQRHTGQDNHQATKHVARQKAIEEQRFWEEEKKRSAATVRLKDGRRLCEEKKRMLVEYQEDIRREREEEERQRANKKKTKKKKVEIVNDYLDDYRSRRTERRMPERDRSLKRRSVTELGQYGTESVPSTKRRRGGEVVLANILEQIVDTLKANSEVSYLFIKPVSKKEAPDYYDIIKTPMDLSKIREKVRKMEYKDRGEFRHDILQIVLNAHAYNDGRNPGIPPLADQLLEICDYLIDQYQESLDEAEAGI